MAKLRMVVIRQDAESHDKNKYGREKHRENHGHEHEKRKHDYILPYEDEATDFMDEEFEEYVEKHGYHFTETLAEHISKKMVNANGATHSWNASQVKGAMESLGLYPLGNNKTEATLGDLTYLANMYYADFYPDVLKDEASCLKAAYKIATDPDGYKGMVFCRWTADAIGLDVQIEWKKFT